MSRETRQEREARRAAEHAARMEELQKTWPQRLLNMAFEYANLPGFSIRRKGELYQFRPSEEILGYDTEFTLPFDVTQHLEMWDCAQSMHFVEDAAQRYHERQAEERRKQEVRRAALDKLTDEERELLGII